MLTRSLSSFRTSLFSTAAAIKSAPEQSPDFLHRRILQIGNPRLSVIPVIDQWIEEGRNVLKGELQVIIRDLRRFRRFRHALEVSQWMSCQKYFHLSPIDFVVQLDLISKVHGIKQLEDYFNSIPEHFKVMEVYSCLFNCYAQEKNVEKAEDIMQKMRDLGLARSTFTYNNMINLYHMAGKHEKVDTIMNEMEEKGIKFNKFSYSILLTAYAACCNTQGLDRTIDKIQADRGGLDLDWIVYSVAANGYTKAGLVDKALDLLKKSERLIVVPSNEKDSTAYYSLLSQYAATGKKDEVLRIWELCKKMQKISNDGYVCMITSLLKFDDIEGADKVFEDWESKESKHDFRIANFIIEAYCKKGLVEKAEDLISRVKARGGNPLAVSWYYLATGYVVDNQIEKAVKAMKVAISMSERGLKPNMETLSACLKHLIEKGDHEEAQKFITILRTKKLIPPAIHAKLLAEIINNICKQMKK